MGTNKPTVTIMLPAYNGERYVASAIRSLLDQTFSDFELIIADDASTDRTGDICREFAAQDGRIRYTRNRVNVGMIANYFHVVPALAQGKYLLYASDHDLWAPDCLERYLEGFREHPEAVVVYSPATIISATGETLGESKTETPRDYGKFSTFANAFSGGIDSVAVNGLIRSNALQNVSPHTSLGTDTILLAELSLYGSFIRLPQSVYFRRQNRPPETVGESIQRYMTTLFERPDEFIASMPFEHMVYKALCMVQNNGLSPEDQRIVNQHILSVFTQSWGVTKDRLAQMIGHMKDLSQKPGYPQAKHRPDGPLGKPERMVLDVDVFFETVRGTPYSEIIDRYEALMGKPTRGNAAKRWPSDKVYDVTYLLFDAGKWGGVKGTIAQANGLTDRGYRVCIVCRTEKPDWIDIHADFVVSPDLSVRDIPASDILIGTWYPTVPLAHAANKGVCVHYCRGYEAQDPGLSAERKSAIEKVYRLATVKIANAPHVERLLREQFGGEVHRVPNDIDHAVFVPGGKRKANAAEVKILVVGPYEVGWKGVRDCIEACRVLREAHGIPVSIVRASQTPLTDEERRLAEVIDCPYEYRFNLSEREMAALYTECDLFVSGSYPYVESFGRPAMEALACGLPAVLTDIPAYRDYDEVHDYALFAAPGDALGMADAMRQIATDAALREGLISRGIEVSSRYRIERTIDALERALQEIYGKHIAKVKVKAKAGAGTSCAEGQYYGFSRPEVQALVDPKSRRILDIGCAAGRMGAELKGKLGAEVWGVEVTAAAAQEAEGRLDRVLRGGIEETVHDLPDGYFDTVVLADVLEHLRDPEETLGLMKQKLAKSGKIVASIPNVRHWSVVKELMEGRWNYQDAGILDRTHLRFFTRSSIVDLFNRAGYEIKEMKATMIAGGGMPEAAIRALTQAGIDTSTLQEESNHYQYLLTAGVRGAAEGVVSIVMLTWNQFECTKECVESIQRYTPEPHEIIFVDNGSTDETLPWLRKLAAERPNYRLVENAANLGFAKGCNQGIAASSGEYILLLNNDVVVTEHWLSGMLECLNRSPKAGIVGPMTNNISGPQQVPAADYASTGRDFETFAAAFRQRNRHRSIAMRRIVGFCMLFRRSLTERIGILDERFGSGNFEDDDLCLRSSLFGYTNLAAGDVFIHHYGSRSFRGNGLDYGTSMTGNRKIFSEKWSGIGADTTLGKKLVMLQAMEAAQDFHARGQTREAVKSMLTVIKKDAGERRLYHELARILIDAGLFGQASELLQQMRPDEADLTGLLLSGYAEEGLGHPAEVDAIADRILKRDPSCAPAMNLKAEVSQTQDDSTTAEAWLRKAIATDPACGETYTNLGILTWAAGRRPEALDLLEHGFVLSPQSEKAAGVYHSAAVALDAQDREEQAFREAHTLYPKNRRMAYAFADILLQRGKTAEAMVCIEEALQRFGIGEGALDAALSVRERIGPVRVPKQRKRGAVSACIIVKNEETDLPRCLMSLRPLAAEIIVVDTGSTDRTRDIATAFGARVFEESWTGDFSAARNSSLQQAEGDWILVVDADEVIAARDLDTLRQMTAKRGGKTAWTFLSRNYVMRGNTMGWTANDGTYAPEEAGSGWIPSRKVRLFPNDRRIRFENPVHELVEPSLERIGIPMTESPVPIHHYGKLNEDRCAAKGESYYEMGKKKLAEQQESAQAFCELALQAQELGKYEEAFDLWQQSIRLAPDRPQSYLSLRYVCLEMDRFDEALAAARTALELAPTMKEAIYNCGLCELYAGDAPRAVSLFEDLVRREPGYYLGRIMLAIASCCAGRGKAAEELKQFMRGIPADSEMGTSVAGIIRKLLIAQRREYAAALIDAAGGSLSGNAGISDAIAQCNA